jgi:RHS repeat-associated protein
LKLLRIDEKYDSDSDEALEATDGWRPMNQYLHGPGAIGQIVRSKWFDYDDDTTATTCSTGYYYYQYDAVGNVIGVIEEDNGQFFRFEMDAFGNDLAGGNSFLAMDQPGPKEHLTGKMYDTDTGLYYFSARWYDPEVGRFVGRDRNRRDIEHPYSICQNNITNNIDPYGTLSLPYPLNSRVCNHSTDMCLIVWSGPYRLLRPGECTSFWKDEGDFAYWNANWYKCRGGRKCFVDDRPLDEYEKSPNYLPPYDQDDLEEDWRPPAPPKTLCEEYCECNSKSSKIDQMKDKCECVEKCLTQR